MVVKREDFKISQLKEALAFSFSPSISVYNILATLIVCLTIYFVGYDKINNDIGITSIVVSVTQQGWNPAFTLVIVVAIVLLLLSLRDMSFFLRISLVCLLITFSFFSAYLYLYFFKKQKLIEEQGFSPVTSMFSDLLDGNTGLGVQADYQAGIIILLVSYLVVLLLSIRGTDISAQIVEEDYGRPRWLLGDYIPMKVLGKLFVVLLLGGLLLGVSIGLTALFVSSVSGLGIWAKSLISFCIFLELLFFSSWYPSIVLTLIRTEKFLETLSVKENKKTIAYYVGKKNYMILACLIANVVIVVLLYALILEGLGLNLITFVGALIICYFSLHFFSAIHYLIGLLSGYEELKEKEKELSEYELDMDEFIDDVRYCIKNGYPEDAVTLLNNAIQSRSEKPEAILSMFKILIDTYRVKGEVNKVNKARKDMVDYTYRDAPYLKKKVMPIMVDLFLEGEFEPSPDEIRHLAEAAFKTDRYEAVIKLVDGFAKKNPIHIDIVDNYYWLAKTLIVKKQYKKAYSILTSLIKKYPTHELIIDVRSERLVVKQKLLSADLPQNKLKAT